MLQSCLLILNLFPLIPHCPVCILLKTLLDHLYNYLCLLNTFSLIWLMLAIFSPFSLFVYRCLSIIIMNPFYSFKKKKSNCGSHSIMLLRMLSASTCPCIFCFASYLYSKLYILKWTFNSLWSIELTCFSNSWAFS